MYQNFNYHDTGTTLSAPQYDKLNRPMPSREELLARNSFGSVNDNRHLDRMLAQNNASEVARLQSQLAQLLKEQK